MDQAMTAFAEKHGVKMTEDKSALGKKLELAASAMHYNNRIYLMFFKAFKQEMYMLDAIQRSDLNAYEQNRNALSKIAVETLEVLDTTKNFRNDPSLKIACRKMMEFYKSEAGPKGEVFSEFFLKKENFERIKESVEAKNQSQRTKADIDNYNKAMEEFNLMVKKSNTLNQELNKNRSTLLNNWNQASQNFLGKHIPTK
jgi:hypothetical protein